MVINIDQFNQLFPFYILINEDLKVQSFGKSLGKISSIKAQDFFSDLFYLRRPELEFSNIEELKALIGQMILLEYKGENKFSLRGQIEFLPDTRQIYFVGSPWFNSMDEVKAKGLTIHDFAIHDPVIDLLHVLGNQQIANNEIKELLLTVQKQKNALSGINQLASNLLNKNTLDEIAWEIIDNTISRFDLEDCVIYLVDESEEFLLQIAAYGDKQGDQKEVLDPIKIKIGEGIVGGVAQTGEARLINNTSQIPEYIIDDKIRYSELTVPIIADGKVIGVIDSEHSKKGFFTKQHLSDFKTIANLTAIKIKNAKAQAKQIMVERALEENRKRYEQIVENAGDIIYRTNRDGFFTYANPMFIKTAGYTLEELRMLHFLDLIDEQYKEEVARFYEDQAANTIAETYMEFPAIAKGGEVVWIGQRTTFHFQKDGTVKDVTAVARDISDKKSAEIALQKSVEKYRGIIANMELGLIEVDLYDRVQYVNQSFCKMSGYEDHELLGQKASEILLAPQERKVIQEKNKLRKNKVSDAYEVEAYTKNKEKRWWLISGAPHYDKNGKLIGSIGIHLDITKQKNLESALKKAKQLAEESSKAKEYFLANMSHEIRTPLNAIIGMVRELKRTNLDINQGAYTKNADIAANHLLSIINNILDLSKIEAGELHLEKSHFDLNEVVHDVYRIMITKAKEKSLDLSISVLNKISPAYIGDPARIRQVLINLLGNAIKFTEKGSVRLNCNNITNTSTGEPIVHINISDTGIGMDESFFENIFEKFTQEDKSTARKYGGTGLGMTITYELVQLMGGEIKIQSEKGKGTSLDIYLPLPIGDTQKIILEKDNPNFDYLKGKSVLLVEDNEMNRLVAIQTLSNFEIKTTEVENGKEAVDLLKSRQFDFILMDIQMPVMDGITATRLIRNELKISTPIIALTANAFKKQIKVCLEAGIDAYVTKPFDEDQFLKTVLKTIDPGKISASVPEAKEQEDAPLTNEKLYDLSSLIDSSQDNDEFVNKMIALFIKMIPDAVEKMNAAYEQKNFQELYSVTHRIKPSVNHMGVQSLKDEIVTLEVLSKDNPESPRIPILLEKVTSVLTKVISDLKAEYPLSNA